MIDMLFSLPTHEVLYKALLARDLTYEGRVYVGVRSTGVFCRLSCTARKPASVQCAFFESVGACVAAGFRPCKRCHPLANIREANPLVDTLLCELEKRPGYRWREADLLALGIDPSTVRRSFKRCFGITFLELARQRRLGAGFRSLSEGHSVIDAQFDAGFESPSAFRAAFARLLGLAPGRLSAKAALKADWIDTPLGAMLAISDAQSLHLLEFIDRKALRSELLRLFRRTGGNLGIGRFGPTEQVEAELHEFFAGRNSHFKVPVALNAADFTRMVWDELRNIPAGETRSYQDIAHALGRPSAVRAVARANGANQIAIVIPCHRVIGADGSMVGYGGGLWRKQKLIALEVQYKKTFGNTARAE